MSEWFSEWEQILRYDGYRTYVSFRCPHCSGSGISPYVDVYGKQTRCECCSGHGHLRGKEKQYESRKKMFAAMV